MRNQIAALFGVTVRFDGGLFLYDPTTGKYTQLSRDG